MKEIKRREKIVILLIDIWNKRSTGVYNDRRYKTIHMVIVTHFSSLEWTESNSDLSAILLRNSQANLS